MKLLPLLTLVLLLGTNARAQRRVMIDCSAFDTSRITHKDTVIHSIEIIYPGIPSLQRYVDTVAIRAGDLLLVPVAWGAKAGEPMIHNGRVYVLRGYYPVYAPTEIVDPDSAKKLPPPAAKDYIKSIH